jgi:hypothetical protein
MISRRRARWLDGQFQGWVEAGLVSPDQALRLHDHAAASDRRDGAVPLFAVLGAALIGLGVILLLGHNWEDMTRATRAMLCLGLVVAGQGLAVRTALQRRDSVAWIEGSAVFATLTFAAGLALIGQTYQIPGDLRGFLNTWWWVSIPLVYALESRGIALLVIFQIMGLYLLSFMSDGPDPWHWVRLLALAPFFVLLRAGGAIGLRERLVATLMLLAVAGSALMGALTVGGVGFVLAAALLAVGLHALDTTDEWISIVIGSPARTLGLLGAATLVSWFGIGELWGIVDFDGGRHKAVSALLPSLAITIGAAALAVTRAATHDGPDRISEWIVTALPIVMAAGAGLAIAFDEDPGQLAASLLVSGYGLVLGSSEVLRGIRSGERFHANLGMSLLLFVIGLRFMSWELSFTARGLAFIAAGVAFLLLNLEIRRRARVSPKEDA